jgi:hypothetical protein
MGIEQVRWNARLSGGSKHSLVGQTVLWPRTRAEPLELVSSSLLFAGIVLLWIFPRAAGYVLVASVAARITAHLVTGIVCYRATMSRPWPMVAPVVDDEW